MRRRSAESDEGLATDHGAIGSEAWWLNVGRGVVPREEVNGKVARVFWGSMNDYPMFALRSSDGAETEWAREGDVTRYAVGAGARVTYVLARWKPRTAQQIQSETTKLVLEIAVEDIQDQAALDTASMFLVDAASNRDLSRPWLRRSIPAITNTLRRRFCGLYLMGNFLRAVAPAKS
jgi:hypothetical protein